MRIAPVRSVHVVIAAAALAWGLAHCAMGSADSLAEADGSPSDKAGEEVPAPPTVNTPRLIEESDIYKVDGTTLYILNRYRGLQVLDIADLDRPRFLGQFPIYGYPKEMFLRGPNAYVIVADSLEFWDDPGQQEAEGALLGSRRSLLRIINVADPAAMTLVGGMDIDGDVFDQRIVGHVLYLVSSTTPECGSTGAGLEPGSEVVSLDIADPAHVTLADAKHFPSGGATHHVAVTTRAIFMAESTGAESLITYIDISDPAGAIAVRGQVHLPGEVIDRFAMDERGGVLRVAVGNTQANGAAGVVTVSVADPDNLRVLGTAMLDVNEQVTSARFDGERGYLVTFRITDPLFVFDLSDPARPRMTAALEMSGWLDFMVPLGDRLLAMGHDDVAGTIEDGVWSRRTLAVSLIDPSGERPRLLARVSLDGTGGWAPAERDDYNKLFRVFPDEGLVVFPYRSYDVDQWRVTAGIQLVDFTRDTLTPRANITNAGWVERGTLQGPETLLTISSQVFQALDITNRDQPRLRSRVELARHVTDVALVGGGVAVQLSGDFNLGSAKLTVTPQDAPDTLEPLAQVDINAPTGRLFRNGSMAYVVGSFSPYPAYAYWPWMQDRGGADRRTTITTVDLAEPLSPMVLSTIRLPKEVAYAGHPGHGAYGYEHSTSVSEVVQVAGTVLALHRPAYGYLMGCSDGPADGGEDEIYVVDLARPELPRLAATITLSGASYAQGLHAAGHTLYVTGTVYSTGGTSNRLYRFDLTDPDNPRDLGAVSIPGQLVGFSDDGGTAYLLRSGTGAASLRTARLGGKVADEVGRVDLGAGKVSGALCAGGTCVVTLVPAYYPYDWSPAMDASAQSSVEVVDVSDPTRPVRGTPARAPTDSARVVNLVDGYAFVMGTSGTFAYRAVAGPALRFAGFFRASGFANGVAVEGGRAWIPTGYHGVQQAELGALAP